jgi:hypothetical protein
MSPTSTPIRLLLGSLVAVVAATPTVLAVSVRGAGAVASAGTAVLVDDAGSSHGISQGGSETRFSLRLPNGATCPGDSADAGYRVQSFLVPASDDAGSLRYFSVMPVGKGRYALYDVDSNPYIQAQTARASRQGGPGPIVNIPAFNFAVFPPGVLPARRYHVGIACSLHNATVRYWATDIQLTRAPHDRPAQLHWRALDARGTSSSGPSGWLLAAAVAVVVLTVAPSARYVRRRRQADTPSSKVAA